MPKIMYRPNPVPPPFEPPTPVYPENSISFSPTSFVEGQNVTASIHKVVTSPETTKVKLVLNNSEIGTQIFDELPVEPNYIENLSIPFVSEFNFDAYENATLYLWNGVEYETEIDLTLVL